MTCKSCLQKAYEKYRRYGFSHDEALQMARKLMRRVERRKRKERIRYFYRFANSFLWRWTFLCQWRATLLWSARLRRLMWIGRGFNPDYTQNCSGACSGTQQCPHYAEDCLSSPDCRADIIDCPMNTCGCPAPLAHSSQVSNACTCHPTASACNVCGTLHYTCTTRYTVCTCAGTCGYNCDSGYTWNGSQCVAAGGILRRLLMGVGL